MDRSLLWRVETRNRSSIHHQFHQGLLLKLWRLEHLLWSRCVSGKVTNNLFKTELHLYILNGLYQSHTLVIMITIYLNLRHHPCNPGNHQLDALETWWQARDGHWNFPPKKILERRKGILVECLRTTLPETDSYAAYPWEKIIILSLTPQWQEKIKTPDSPNFPNIKTDSTWLIWMIWFL